MLCQPHSTLCQTHSTQCQTHSTLCQPVLLPRHLQRREKFRQRPKSCGGAGARDHSAASGYAAVQSRAGTQVNLLVREARRIHLVSGLLPCRSGSGRRAVRSGPRRRSRHESHAIPGVRCQSECQIEVLEPLRDDARSKAWGVEAAGEGVVFGVC